MAYPMYICSSCFRRRVALLHLNNCVEHVAGRQGILVALGSEQLSPVLPCGYRDTALDS